MCDDTPRCVIEAAHARWAEEARHRSRLVDWARQTMLPICRNLGIDPDGPLEPMRPAALRRRDAAAEREEHYRRIERDAALIAAIAKLRG